MKKVRESVFAFGRNGSSKFREKRQSSVKYMISLRLKHAEQLLALSTLSIAEIAACGYSSPSFFTYEFKKHSGITPRQFRAQSHSR